MAAMSVVVTPVPRRPATTRMVFCNCFMAIGFTGAILLALLHACRIV